MEKKTVELFAGVGGFRLGLERLGSGWETVWFSQWEPGKKNQWAHDCYERHFGKCADIEGNTERTGQDIALMPKGMIPDHTLLVGGFPCFPEGALVLTVRGFVPIEEVKVGDLVLTHRGRWREVLETGARRADTVILRGQGTAGIECTPNHPFLTRAERKDVHPADGANGVPVLEDEEKWTGAEDCEGLFWANIYGIESLDIPPVCEAEGRTAEDPSARPEFWYFVGRWLKDGYISGGKTRGKESVFLFCPHGGMEELRRHLGKSGLSFSPYRDNTGYRIHIRHPSDLGAWLERHFGRNAEDRTVPAWMFGAPEHIRTNFLKGYLESHMYRIRDEDMPPRRIRMSGMSAKTSAGMKILLEQRGYAVSVAIPSARPARLGSAVPRAEEPYRIEAEKDSPETVREKGLAWGRIERAEEERKGVTVYRLTVDEDHSYTVDGIAVKNCQDYSVAHTLASSKGIEGKKGVLWWQIRDILSAKRPAFCLFENVDRLLKSPAKQRGRDFGIILACLADLGYSAEWRVVNAAQYGAAQRRRRTFIFAYRNDTAYGAAADMKDAETVLSSDGLMAKAFPVTSVGDIGETVLPDDIVEVSDRFAFAFEKAGYMHRRKIYTAGVTEETVPPVPLGEILEKNVDEKYYIPEEKLPKWEYLKGSKKIDRVSKDGYAYTFAEGPVAFPDPPDRPGRTMLTSESTLNRSTHAVADPGTGRLRTLTPVEAERLQGFDDNWTDSGMPERMRYFCMGNALVVPMITRMGKVLDGIIDAENAAEGREKAEEEEM